MELVEIVEVEVAETVEELGIVKEHSVVAAACKVLVVHLNSCFDFDSLFDNCFVYYPLEYHLDWCCQER